MTIVLGLLFLVRAVDGLAAAGRKWFLCRDDAEQFVRLFADRDACVHLMGGVLALLVAGVASLLRRLLDDAQHRGGRHGVVLAFHGRAVDLHFVFDGVCRLSKRF